MEESCYVPVSSGAAVSRHKVLSRLLYSQGSAAFAGFVIPFFLSLLHTTLRASAVVQTVP